MSVTQATKAKVKNIAAIVTCAALVLILFGAALAQRAHTSGGKVQIEDIRFVTEDGGYLRALLYIPQGVSPAWQRRLPSSRAMVTTTRPRCRT